MLMLMLMVMVMLMVMLMLMLMLMLMVGADRWSARSRPARNASTHGVDLLPAQ
ncbi:hypothetical protein [Stenotrophomonas maltophilia]|uniref:hypothetical protein n=1 Tax=Stenotrophomonas maltophilia TaxID=40324 RepID=UPI00130448C5|nr:hypothetical protein [Stenotrophomonas maltophilia]